MNILVAYTTNSGSTEDVARAIGEELGQGGAQVDVRRLEEVTQIDGYQAVVVGGPMILGWHRAARNFVHKHRAELSRAQVAYFCTAMALTATGEERIGETPLCIDPGLAKPPHNPQHLGIKENYARPANYLKPILGAAPAVKPLSVGFFGGKLELFKLNLLQMLFVSLVVGAQPGDLRDLAFVRGWAAGLRKAFEK